MAVVRPRTRESLPSSKSLALSQAAFAVELKHISVVSISDYLDASCRTFSCKTLWHDSLENFLVQNKPLQVERHRCLAPKP